jgi:hypothetical protein
MQNVIEAVTSQGDVIFRVVDGGYIVAQQIDAKPLKPAQILEGTLETIGIESATDPATGLTYEFFIAGYGLSREGAFGAPE